MVKKKLVEELVNDGARLLPELDRRDFPVESMFWIDVPDQDYWRLVIASSIVSEQGATVAYRRLEELLRGIELAGIALEDISLLDPHSGQFQSLLHLAVSSSRLAVGAAWIVFEDAVVYRWTRASLSGELSCDVTPDELNRFWEAERKTLPHSHPALLIGLEGRRFTLRFHPQHGPQDTVAGVKRGFAIALHRPEARPDCKITWLGESPIPV